MGSIDPNGLLTAFALRVAFWLTASLIFYILRSNGYV